jgi:hypothetical protein
MTRGSWILDFGLWINEPGVQDRDSNVPRPCITTAPVVDR